MDNSEFESRAFANPDDTEQDFLDAMQAVPQRRQLLDEVQSLNNRLKQVTASINAPADFARRLKSAVPDEDLSVGEATASSSVVDFPNARRQPSRLVAIAAALALAVGITYSSLFLGNQPSAQEIEFGQQIVNHIYMELDEINASPGASYQQINQVFSAVGANIADPRLMEEMGISFAKPCSIIPENNGAHLVMEGEQGVVNIIVVDNSPVSQQFTVSDERFEAVIIPLEHGNLILVGEKDEPFSEVQQELVETVTWVI